MGDVVGGVAVRDPVGDRDRPVRADGQDQQQLLQIRPEVLVVTVPDRRRRLPAAGPAVGVGVGAGQGHGGGVVVQLGDVQVELVDGCQHGRGDQAGPVGVEQPVQHPTDPVIVQRGGIAGFQSQDRRVVVGRPFPEGVDRSMPGRDVGHHHSDHAGGWQPQPGVVVGQVGVQVLGQAEAGQEEVHHGQAPQPLAA